MTPSAAPWRQKRLVVFLVLPKADRPTSSEADCDPKRKERSPTRTTSTWHYPLLTQKRLREIEAGLSQSKSKMGLRGRSESVESLADYRRRRFDEYPGRMQRFTSHVARSFSPVHRPLYRSASMGHLSDFDPSLGRKLYRSPVPFHSRVTRHVDEQPFRKYDIFSLRTWSYPIWKHLYGREERRPSDLTPYELQTTYTPPTMTGDYRPFPSRHGYSGYGYVAGDASYHMATSRSAIDNYHFWRQRTTASPWYWSYYGHSSKYFGGYRPHTIYPHRVTSLWTTPRRRHYY